MRSNRGWMNECDGRGAFGDPHDARGARTLTPFAGSSGARVVVPEGYSAAANGASVTGLAVTSAFGLSCGTSIVAAAPAKAIAAKM